MLRKDYEAVLQRNVEFASQPEKKGALLHVTSIAGQKTFSAKHLEEWDLPKDYKSVLEDRIAACKLMWAQRPELEDDQLPTLKPFYGIAEHSSFIGGEVTYGGNTSYHHAIISGDYSELDALELREDNVQFRMLLDSLDYLRRRGETEGFVPSLRGGDSPLDIANAIRGNDLFYDVYDQPENVRRLMEFCTKACLWTFRHQKAVIPQVMGGTMTGLGVWLPGDSIGHLSEDATCLCSPAMYAEFGRPYLERVLAEFDGAILHTHSMGRRTLPEFCSLDGLTAIELSRDPNQPAPIDVYREYAADLEGKLVVLTMDTQEIRDNLEFLAGRRSIIELSATDMADAKAALDLVRSSF